MLKKSSKSMPISAKPIIPIRKKNTVRPKPMLEVMIPAVAKPFFLPTFLALPLAVIERIRLTIPQGMEMKK